MPVISIQTQYIEKQMLTWIADQSREVLHVHLLDGEFLQYIQRTLRYFPTPAQVAR